MRCSVPECSAGELVGSDLSKDVSKSSALDFEKTQAQVPKVGTEQSQFVKSAPGKGLGLGL